MARAFEVIQTLIRMPNPRGFGDTDPELFLWIAKYGTGNIALTAYDNRGEQWYCVSVNLAPYGSRPLKDREVWLKGWSENEGLPEAMQRRGLITLTGETMPSGYVHAQLAIVNDEIWKIWEAAHAET